MPGNRHRPPQTSHPTAHCLETAKSWKPTPLTTSHHGKGRVPGNGTPPPHMPPTPGHNACKPTPLTTSRHGKGAVPGNGHRPTRATHSTAQCLETNAAHHRQRSAWKWTPSHTCHPFNGAVPGNQHRSPPAAQCLEMDTVPHRPPIQRHRARKGAVPGNQHSSPPATTARAQCPEMDTRPGQPGQASRPTQASQPERASQDSRPGSSHMAGPARAALRPCQNAKGPGRNSTVNSIILKKRKKLNIFFRNS